MNRKDMEAYFESATRPAACETKQDKATISNHSFLPEGFVPGENDVVIGRSMKYYNHSGNRRLRNMVTAKLDEYSKADKSEKSFIITEVMEKVHERSPNGGGFLKLDPASGRWYMVGEYLSREKVSQTFRDALGNYRSSSIRKKERRKIERARAYAEIEMRSAKRHKAGDDLQFSSSQMPSLPIPPQTKQEDIEIFDVLATILPPGYERDPNPLEPNHIMYGNSMVQQQQYHQPQQQCREQLPSADMFEPVALHEPSAYDAFQPFPSPSNASLSHFLAINKSIDDSGGRRNKMRGLALSRLNIRHAMSA